MGEQVRHELPSPWEFWVSKAGSNEYEIEPIASFSTIEDFWQVFLQFPSIEDLRHGGLSLFKKGIRPAWEDPKNAGGQAARLTSFRATKENWEHLVTAVIGGSLEAKMTTAPLCGVSAVWRAGANRLLVELWFGRGEIDRQQLGAAVEVEPSTIAVKPHKRM